MWVYASQRSPLSVLARNPHKGRARGIIHETGRGRGKARSESRTEQSRTEESRQRTEQRSRQKRAGARACGLRDRVDQRERMSQHSWWLCGNFTRIHARASPQMHRKLRKSVTNFSLLALGANPSLCLFVVYVVFCVSVKKYP